MLDGEHLARAAEAGLDLIGYKKNAVAIAEIAQRAHELERRDVEAALALHRLNDDRGDARRLDLGAEDLFDTRETLLDRHAAILIGKCRVENVGRKRTKADFVWIDFAGERQRHHRAPVKSSGERNDRGTAGRRARHF